MLDFSAGKRWNNNNNKLLDTVTTLDDRIDKHLCQEIKDTHNSNFNEYKDNFYGHNFWREFMQTVNKDEALSVLST